MGVNEFFGRVSYFLKVWIGVMAGLVFCYFVVLLGNNFMDWVFTFTEEQIFVGIMVFAATVTASVMTALTWLEII